MARNLIMILLQVDFVADQAQSTYNALELGCQALAFLFGLVGALRIYNKWQLHGHHLHIDKEIAGWIGASLFFLCVDEFISSVLL
jgi:hypothetical protein